MKHKITVGFAGININVETDYTYMDEFCREYLSDGEPDISVAVTQKQTEEEIRCANGRIAPQCAESLCIYREIAERMPLFDRAVFHGAAIEYGGKAYLFTAPSGTGKTTHIMLWKKYLGDDKVTVINGDKPIISVENGNIVVYGTPYAGKENYQNNISASLGGVCVLSQGKQNVIKELSPKEAYTKLFLQTYKPYGEAAMHKTLELVRLLCGQPCYALSCDISEEAVKTSFEKLTGEKYEDKKQ